MPDDEPIRTPRLDLHTVRPADYALLAGDRADPRLWVDRGFSNPAGHLVVDAGPLPFRFPRVAEHPEGAPFYLRMAVLREGAVIVGSAGFHDLPDEQGMVEIGLGIEPGYRRRGLGDELLRGMWRWVIDQPGVVTLRYTVSTANEPSQAMIRAFGFAHVGQQEDETDGTEDVYELSAADYRRRFC
jgi:RimJ/RimL family protein N-acetyltransferase